MFTKLLVVIQIVTPGVAIVKSGTFSITVSIGVTFSIFVSGWAKVMIVRSYLFDHQSSSCK